MLQQLPEDWKDVLQDELEKDYFRELQIFLEKECAGKTVYPPSGEIFHAFRLCPFPEVKVVIIGQDPYHGPGQAHGLCFSVRDGVTHPPSLRNIYREIQNDLGIDPPVTGNLDRWAEQGVLLLNATLTVEHERPGSHQDRGWERFTDAVISRLSDMRENLVFLLWGAYAIKKGRLVNSNRHLVLTSAHPSPLSAYRGFFGNRHFSQTNQYLTAHGKEPISW